MTAYIGAMATKASKWHGRVEGTRDCCAHPACDQAGEFKAPLSPSSFDGPGAWRFLCLEHVREHNARYNYFAGMSPEEISAAQSPLAGWERETRAFATGGGDPPATWSNFTDPLDAIGARFGARGAAGITSARFAKAERSALAVLGLNEECNLSTMRRRYSALVRRYHPDKNGGDRAHEHRLRAVVEAYQLLRKSAAFA
ncbi:MAG: J domain-containing protein [Sphingomicrobium sp.]